MQLPSLILVLVLAQYFWLVLAAVVVRVTSLNVHVASLPVVTGTVGMLE